MQTRCHLCGTVIDARDAVRREMKLIRAEGDGSAFSSGPMSPGVYTSYSSGQSYYGLVDLCPRCDDEEEELERQKMKEANRIAKKRKVEWLIAILAVPLAILGAILFVIVWGFVASFLK